MAFIFGLISRILINSLSFFIKRKKIITGIIYSETKICNMAQIPAIPNSFSFKIFYIYKKNGKYKPIT